MCNLADDAQSVQMIRRALNELLQRFESEEGVCVFLCVGFVKNPSAVPHTQVVHTLTSDLNSPLFLSVCVCVISLVCTVEQILSSLIHSYVLLV